MTDTAALAKAAGCSVRTVQRWLREGAPLPAPSEDLKAWKARVEAWDEGRPPRREGRVFTKKRSAGKIDWEQRSKRALAEKREFELQVLRGDFLERKVVEVEWARRAFAVSRKFLALPRSLATRCANSPPDIVEAEATQLVRDAIAQYLENGPLTTRPVGLDDGNGDKAAPAPT